MAEAAVPEGMTKRDVSCEEWREYTIPAMVEGKVVYATYRIVKPVTLYIKPTERGDSHRVVDSDGVMHYVRAGWINFRSKGDPEVSF